MSTGARTLVETLAELGVEVAFGLPGVHTLPLWDALAPSDIAVLGVRHEQAAGHAADGFARATGALGVALVTTGPGAANVLTAVGEARASGSPVLVLATEVPSELRREGTVRGSLHEVGEQRALFAPVTKAAFSVQRPGELAAVLRRAARLALTPQSGPVYVGVPADFLGAEIEPGPGEARAVDAGDTDRSAAHKDGAHGDGADAARGADVARRGRAASSGTRYAVRLPPVPVEDLDETRKALATARRPLIWAGAGALRADAGEALGRLAERVAAPLVTTFAARGLVPPDHPCQAPCPVHTPEVGALWDEADVVLAVGTDFDGMMTQNWRMPRPPVLIAVNVDPEDAGKNYEPDLLLHGDAREVVRDLVLGLPARPGLDELTRRLDEIESRVRRRVRKEEPQAAELLSALRETLPDGAVLVADMCVAGHWIGGFYPVAAPRRLAYPMGWGTHGFGFPASLGVAAAGVARAVCVTGDGGFLHGTGELATAIQENLPVTVVVVDDSGYGMLRHDQRRSGLAHRGVDLVTPDFVGLAKSFGVHADRVGGFGRAFRRLLREFTRADEPNVLVVDAELSPPVNTSARWYRK